MTAPLWLNNEFLEKALRASGKYPDVVLLSGEIGPATMPGDNYVSEMYRAHVKIRYAGLTEETSFIVKTLPSPEKGELAKMINNSDLFEKEINAFDKVLPDLQSYLEEISPGTFQPFAANYIYLNLLPPETVLVLEDLKPQGFRLAKVTYGLDLKHCLLVMKTIARYHASSLKLKNEHPEYHKLFEENIFCREGPESVESFLHDTLPNIIKEVKKWEENSDKYGGILESMYDKAIKIWTNGVKREDSGYSVLTHGDFWMNNMMFRYSEETGEVEDVRFVDFQMSHWTSPAVDLLHFLNCSAAPDVLENNFDLLKKEYHTAFCDTLALLGLEHLHLSTEYLNEEIKKRSLFGVLVGITVRIVALPDKSTVSDMVKGSKKEDGVHLSENYKYALRKLLPLYEKFGWLEVK